MRKRGPIDWRRVAEELGRALPLSALHPRVVAWASDPAHAARTWAVGFSGGADSLGVLLLVWAHWPGQRRRLRALHFNHQLRGRAAAEDARFCARVSEGLGVRFQTETWARTATGRVSEAAAREVRHAFFRRALSRTPGAALWLGHQRDDVAETMLMRLARGSGAGGLAAPRPVHVMAEGRVHLRPLLNVGKAQLVAALRAAGARWREDASNVTGEYFRNRVRRDVLPAWVAAAGRDAVAGAARSRELLEEDDAALEAWTDRLKLFNARGDLRLAALRECPRAVVRRALQRWLLRQPGAAGLSRQAVDALLEAVRRGRPTRHSLGSGGFAVVTKRELMFRSASGAGARAALSPRPIDFASGTSSLAPQSKT